MSIAVDVMMMFDHDIEQRDRGSLYDCKNVIVLAIDKLFCFRSSTPYARIPLDRTRLYREHGEVLFGVRDEHGVCRRRR